jgi:hypothetical protein
MSAAVTADRLRSGVPVLAGLLGSAPGRLAPYDDGDEEVRATVLGVFGAGPRLAATPSADGDWAASSV